ncbi:hypothetical protein Z537_03817, partial [Mycobacterium tuberculosis UT0047]
MDLTIKSPCGRLEG